MYFRSGLLKKCLEVAMPLEFWIVAIVLSYLLTGISQLNSDIREGPMGMPGYVRDKNIGFAILKVFVWPRFMGVSSVLTVLVFVTLIISAILWVISYYIGLLWAGAIVLAFVLFLLVSNIMVLKDR